MLGEGERASSHDFVLGMFYHTIVSRVNTRTGFLPSSAAGRRGGRVDIVFLESAVG